MTNQAATSYTGHRFVAVNAKPYLKAKLTPPVTCAYCQQPAGANQHNTKGR